MESGNGESRDSVSGDGPGGVSAHEVDDGRQEKTYVDMLWHGYNEQVHAHVHALIHVQIAVRAYNRSAMSMKQGQREAGKQDKQKREEDIKGKGKKEKFHLPTILMML